MSSVRVKWFDREFEREVLDPRIIRWLHTIGARGERLSKLIISGAMGAGLKAVDKGFLMNSLTWNVVKERLAVQIGTFIARSDGKPLDYAIHVFFGHATRNGGFVKARPVLRTMLSMIRRELR